MDESQRANGLSVLAVGVSAVIGTAGAGIGSGVMITLAAAFAGVGLGLQYAVLKL